MRKYCLFLIFYNPRLELAKCSNTPPDHADLYDTAWLRVSHNAVFWNSQAYSINDYIA